MTGLREDAQSARDVKKKTKGQSVLSGLSSTAAGRQRCTNTSADLRRLPLHPSVSQVHTYTSYKLAHNIETREYGGIQDYGAVSPRNSYTEGIRSLVFLNMITLKMGPLTR